MSTPGGNRSPLSHDDETAFSFAGTGQLFGNDQVTGPTQKLSTSFTQLAGEADDLKQSLSGLSSAARTGAGGKPATSTAGGGGFSGLLSSVTGVAAHGPGAGGGGQGGTGYGGASGAGAGGFGAGGFGSFMPAPPGGGGGPGGGSGGGFAGPPGGGGGPVPPAAGGGGTGGPGAGGGGGAGAGGGGAGGFGSFGGGGFGSLLKGGLSGGKAAFGGLAGVALTGANMFSNFASSSLPTQVTMSSYLQQQMAMTSQNTGASRQGILNQAFAGNAMATGPSDAAQMQAILNAISGSTAGQAAGSTAPFQNALAGGAKGMNALINYATGSSGTASATLTNQLMSPQAANSLRMTGLGNVAPLQLGGKTNQNTAQFFEALNQSQFFGKEGGTGKGNLSQLAYNLRAGGVGAANLQSMLGLSGQGLQQAETSMEDVAKLQAQGWSQQKINQQFQLASQGNKGAQKTLSQAGVIISDTQMQKNVQAKQMQGQAQIAQSFTAGLEKSTDALSKFYGALDKILKIPAVARMVGANAGALAGVKSMAGSAVKTGIEVGGAVLGGAVGSLIGPEGTVGGAIVGGMIGKTLGGGAAAPGKTTSKPTAGSSSKNKNASGIPAAAGKAVQAAEKELGVKYEWGGETPGKGFDCSGLVQWAYQQAGISLPRTSQAQWSQLKRRQVPIKKVQEGDIVFSAGSDGTASAPGHEGIMANQKQVIQAPYCVSLSTMILTKRGWLKYDELNSDDKTLGYDIGTNTLQWTEITDINVFSDVPVVRAGNSKISVEVTANHSWVTLRRSNGGWQGKPELIPLEDVTQGSKILLSAVADTGAGLPISDIEAEILAWAQGDGSIRLRPSRSTGVWSTGTRDSVDMNLTQSKPEYVEHIRKLLTGISHTEKIRKQDPRARYRQHVWYLTGSYVRDLLQRCGFAGGTPESMVLAMSMSQRKAWLRGIDGAEGSHTRKDSTITITQNDGPLQDAIALCMYLLGYYPSYQKRYGPGKPKRRITACKPSVHVIKTQFSMSYSRHTTVWCPTTRLGSWTARQGDQIFVTGNTGKNVEISAFDPGNWLYAARPAGNLSGSAAGGPTTAAGANAGNQGNAGAEHGTTGGGGADWASTPATTGRSTSCRPSRARCSAGSPPAGHLPAERPARPIPRRLAPRVPRPVKKGKARRPRAVTPPRIRLSPKV